MQIAFAPARRTVIGFAFAAVVTVSLSPSAAAQQAVEHTIHDFDVATVTCADCTLPPIEGIDGALYGTTPSGGAYNKGVLYRITPYKGYHVLHDFGQDLKSYEPTGAPVQLANGDLFGVTINPSPGGRERPGALWRLTHEGKYHVLDRFIGPNGARPNALMASPDGRLFGTTTLGGTFNRGVLFTVDAFGRIQPVYSFSSAAGAYLPRYAPLLGSDGAFYGIAQAGGKHGLGAVWRYRPGDGKFQVVHSFGAAADEGTNPSSKLIEGRDGALYGMTRTGPNREGFGTLYRIGPDGNYTTLHTFTGPDGAFPRGGLTEDAAGNLLGATESSTNGSTVGTAFKLAPDGTLTTIYDFVPAHDGEFPTGLMLASNGRAYGVASFGGAFDKGTIWQLTLP